MNMVPFTVFLDEKLTRSKFQTYTVIYLSEIIVQYSFIFLPNYQNVTTVSVLNWTTLFQFLLYTVSKLERLL